VCSVLADCVASRAADVATSPRRLPLRGPRDETAAKKHNESGGGPARVRTAGPVGVVVGEVGGRRSSKEAEVGAAPKVPLHSGEMWLLWGVHMEVYLLDDVGDVGPGEDEVLQRPGETPVASGISHRGALEEETLP
jgi:hypothetical protein